MDAMVRATVLAAVLALATVACGITGEAARRPTTVADLEPALLTEGEVGQGFTLSTEEDDDDTGFDASPRCQKVLDQLEAGEAEPDEKRSADFKKEDTGAEVNLDLTLAEDLGTTIDDYLEFVRDCGELPLEDDSGTVKLDAERVEDLGDEAMLLKIEIDLQEPIDVTVRATGYLWIRDDVAAMVQATDGIDEDSLESAPLPDGFARTLATKADRKLERTLAAKD